MPFPPRLKRAGAAGLGLSPQARFERCLFLIGHMRCGSTALANILCAHPEVSGYGESHVTYDHQAAPAALILNQIRRRRWKPRARFLFDKILHDRLDAAAPPAFHRARAIFLFREPAPAIASIQQLFDAIGSREYASADRAAAYYAGRLAGMRRLWSRFPADRRIALSYEDLVSTPTGALARLSAFLDLAPPLRNAYPAEASPLRAGAGDPLAAPHLTGIVVGGLQGERAAVSVRSFDPARKAHDDFRTLAVQAGDAA